MLAATPGASVCSWDPGFAQGFGDLLAHSGASCQHCTVSLMVQPQVVHLGFMLHSVMPHRALLGCACWHREYAGHLRLLPALLLLLLYAAGVELAIWRQQKKRWLCS